MGGWRGKNCFQRSCKKKTVVATGRKITGREEGERQQERIERQDGVRNTKEGGQKERKIFFGGEVIRWPDQSDS